MTLPNRQRRAIVVTLRHSCHPRHPVGAHTPVLRTQSPVPPDGALFVIRMTLPMRQPCGRQKDNMSTDIPRARMELKRIADGLADYDAAAAINAIVDTLMVRSFTGRKARAKHRRMTDEIAEDVRVFAAAHPDYSHEEIARPFDINPGRVSEVLSGKKFVNGRAVKS